MTVTTDKKASRQQEQALIEKELEEFWKSEDKDNYLLVIIGSGKGFRRLCYNYENTRQIVGALIIALKVELGLDD